MLFEILGIRAPTVGSSGIYELQSIDQLLVKQTVLASSFFSDYRGNKQFIIKNSFGENVKFEILLSMEFDTNSVFICPIFGYRSLWQSKAPIF